MQPARAVWILLLIISIATVAIAGMGAAGAGAEAEAGVEHVSLGGHAAADGLEADDSLMATDDSPTAADDSLTAAAGSTADAFRDATHLERGDVARASAQEGPTPRSRTTIAPSGDVAASGSTSDDVVERVVYRQRSDGELEAEIVYDVPSALTELELRLDDADLEVVDADGFDATDRPDLRWGSASDDPTFAWDGRTDQPRVVVRQDVADEDRPTYVGGTADWAVVLRPSTSARWRYSGTEPGFDREAAVDGEGVAGEQYLVLGPHEVHETTVEGERIRLVVPDAAEPASDPERILAALADASERLDVGHRNDVVTIVATPTADVDWAHRGLALGPDARVNDDVSLEGTPDLWIHEYVHTRQNRAATTDATEWLVEATAEYYAATVALERGQASFEDYRAALERGGEGPAGESVLAEPDTWRGQANYRKGLLVVAGIDRELREATDGDATFADVVTAWNEADEFDAEDFAAELESLGGPAVREYAEEHATTSATPDLWDERTHEEAFDVALASVEVGDPSVDVVAGENDRLVVQVDVENAGDAVGHFRIPLRVDGSTVDVVAGALDAGESRTVEFDHVLPDAADSGPDRTREHTVSVGQPAEANRLTISAPAGASTAFAAGGIGTLDGFSALLAPTSSAGAPAGSARAPRAFRGWTTRAVATESAADEPQTLRDAVTVRGGDAAIDAEADADRSAVAD